MMVHHVRYKFFLQQSIHLSARIGSWEFHYLEVPDTSSLPWNEVHKGHSQYGIIGPTLYLMSRFDPTSIS